MDLLIEGIEINEDRISDLEQKLRRIPRELNELFRTILDSVEPQYHELQAHMLRTACAACTSLSLMAYYFMDIEDEDDIIRMPVEPMLAQEIEMKQNIMATRISVRCKGLLEVVKNRSRSNFGSHTVKFIHRTFRDYLAEKEIESLMASRSAPGFDVYRVMCLAAFAELKASSFDMTRECYQHACFKDMIHYASEGERAQGSKVSDILDVFFERLVGKQAPMADSIKRHDRSIPIKIRWEGYCFMCSIEDVIFASAHVTASFDLLEYPKKQIAKLQSQGKTLDDILAQTISGAHLLVNQVGYKEYMSKFAPVDLMEILLDMGANVDTFWEQFIIEWNSMDNGWNRQLTRCYFGFEDPLKGRLTKVLLSYSDGIPEKAAKILEQ